ncbi:hypothetical protein U3A98_003953 [Cronobacter turicensis]|nr:hypothetical protein [Cronobacter turicensis]
MELREFFNDFKVKDALDRYIKTLSVIEAKGGFKHERNERILQMLRFFWEKGEYWDEHTQHNIAYIGDVFLEQLKNRFMEESNLNEMFADCLRFTLEASISQDSSNYTAFFRVQQDFALNNLELFDHASQGQIKYAFYEMPISIVRDFIGHSNVKTYREFIDAVKVAKDFQVKSSNYIEEKEKRVKELSETLKKHETAFNFVGLYAGFSELAAIKKQELRNSKRLLFLLAPVLTLPIIGEALALTFMPQNKSVSDHLINSIPIISLTLILIYFFRVVLNNFNSIRAQLMQLELRKSLCQFIQSYAEYSKEIRMDTVNPLTKFEEIIFSNIMGTDEKTPSTFDGIEQLAGIIKAIKNK